MGRRIQLDQIAIILAPYMQLSIETCTHLLSINLLLQLLLTSQQPFPLSIMYLSNCLNSGLLFSYSSCPLCQWILVLIHPLSRAEWYEHLCTLYITRQGWEQGECNGSYVYRFWVLPLDLFFTREMSILIIFSH